MHISWPTTTSVDNVSSWPAQCVRSYSVLPTIVRMLYSCACCCCARPAAGTLTPLTPTRSGIQPAAAPLLMNDREMIGRRLAHAFPWNATAQVHLAMALRRREAYVSSGAATIKLQCSWQVGCDASGCAVRRQQCADGVGGEDGVACRGRGADMELQRRQVPAYPDLWMLLPVMVAWRAAACSAGFSVAASPVSKHCVCRHALGNGVHGVFSIKSTRQ